MGGSQEKPGKRGVENKQKLRMPLRDGKMGLLMHPLGTTHGQGLLLTAEIVAVDFVFGLRIVGGDEWAGLL